MAVRGNISAQNRFDLTDLPFNMPLVADVFHGGFPSQTGVLFHKGNGAFGIGDLGVCESFNFVQKFQSLCGIFACHKGIVQQPPALDVGAGDDGAADEFAQVDLTLGTLFFALGNEGQGIFIRARPSSQSASIFSRERTSAG